MEALIIVAVFVFCQHRIDERGQVAPLYFAFSLVDA